MKSSNRIPIESWGPGEDSDDTELCLFILSLIPPTVLYHSN